MPQDIFRAEAVDYHAGSRVEGEVLQMLPGWTRWTYRLLVALFVVFVVFVAVGSVSQYAEGPAVIRAEERVAVTAAVHGIVASVHVRSGMRVQRGDVLLRFRSADEEAQTASAMKAFETALVRMLANPLDQSARQTVAGLRAERDLTTARLSERVVRAPEPGTVGDIRVKPGQSVMPGELLASIAREHARFTVLALLPGQQRPALRAGLPLRLEITGFPYVYQALVLDRVDDEVIGPHEVRRVLGPEVADSVAVSGPVVVVHASLPADAFASDGRLYRYADGMHASARVQLRSERLLTTILPGIRIVTERSR